MIKKYKILNIFVITLVFHTFFAATLAKIGFNYSVYIASVLPYLFAFIFIYFTKTEIKKISKLSLSQWLGVVLIGFLYSVYTKFVYDDLSYIASFKTFFIIPIQLTILYYLLPTTKSIINFKKTFFLLLYIISIYSILEWIVRTYNIPLIYQWLVSYVDIIKPGGLNYLPFGGGFGILPLGLFFDMHTASSVITLTGLLAYVEKKHLLFAVSVVALILSMRYTSIFAFLIGFYILVVPFRFSILTLPLSPAILHFKFSGTHSYDTIMSHFLNNFEPIFNSNIMYIIFGHGYTRTSVVETIGYNEIFFVLFLNAFGFVGILLLLYFMYFLYKSMRVLIINNIVYRYDRLSLAFIVVFLLGLAHYNLSFLPFVLFIYAFVAYYVRFYNKLQGEI